jgi:AraC-like DNA-binding protein
MKKASEIDVAKSGFLIGVNRGMTMRRPHLHGDLEMTIVLKGSMGFVLGGQRVHIPLGQFVLYWAARPHCTVYCSKPFLKYSLHIPLPWFLQLQLPPSFVQRILNGEVVADEDTSRRAEDAACVQRWHREWTTGEPVKQKITLMEVEARLGWMALSPIGRKTSSVFQFARKPLPLAEKVDAMLRFITEHYADPVSSVDVAHVVRLHPKYAMNIFQKTLGMTILGFITAQRIAHAQHLLITTDMKTVDIAFQSGFGTLSRFYKAFTDSLNTSPHAYRMTVAGR